MATGPGTAVQIVNNVPKSSGNPYLPSGDGASTQLPYISIAPEGYKFYHGLIDSRLLYLDTITSLLYDAQLVKVDTIDEDSPVPGYKPVKRKNGWKPACTYEGYKSVMNLVIFKTNAAISTSKTDSSFQLEKFAVDSTISIMRMLIAKRRDWAFTNFALIRPLGLAIWQNIYHIETRSSNKTGGKRIGELVFSPGMFFEKNGDEEEKKKGLKLW